MISLALAETAGDTAPLSAWFATAVLPHEAALKRYLRHRFPEIRDPDDVMQETYLRLFRAYHQGAPLRSPKAFLFTLARNLALDLIRRSRRSPLIEATLDHVLRIPADQPDAAELTARHQEHHCLRQAIDQLPARSRTALELHRLHGLTCEATAAYMGLAPSTVQHHVARALRHCTDYFQENGFMHTSTRKSA